MPQNWCKGINFLSTIILGTWDSLGAHSSLFAEINLSVILIVGGLFVLFKIPQGAGGSSLFTDCPSRISRMWQRQSEEPQPESSVKPDTARPVPEERGWGWNFFLFTFCQSSNKLRTWRLSVWPCKTFPKWASQRLGTQQLES